MPRKPTRSKRRNQQNGLEETDRQWLFYNWTFGKWNRSIPMPEDLERQLWQDHKARLMEVWLDPSRYDGSKFFVPGGPFTRPRAWWKYEAGLEFAPHPEKQWLIRNKRLEPIERRLLEESKS